MSNSRSISEIIKSISKVAKEVNDDYKVMSNPSIPIWEKAKYTKDRLGEIYGDKEDEKPTFKDRFRDGVKIDWDPRSSTTDYNPRNSKLHNYEDFKQQNDMSVNRLRINNKRKLNSVHDYGDQVHLIQLANNNYKKRLQLYELDYNIFSR